MPIDTQQVSGMQGIGFAQEQVGSHVGGTTLLGTHTGVQAGSVSSRGEDLAAW